MEEIDAFTYFKEVKTVLIHSTPSPSSREEGNTTKKSPPNRGSLKGSEEGIKNLYSRILYKLEYPHRKNGCPLAGGLLHLISRRMVGR